MDFPPQGLLATSIAGGVVILGDLNPITDATFVIGTASKRWLDVRSVTMTLPNATGFLRWLDSGGSEQNVMVLDATDNFILSNPVGGTVTIQTTDLTGDPSTRMSFSGGIDTAVMTLTNLTVTGLTLSGAIDFNGQNIDDVLNITLTDEGAIQTGSALADFFTLDARDVNGAVFVTFITLTANNTPSITIGTTTASTQTFTGTWATSSFVLAATQFNGNVTFSGAETIAGIINTNLVDKSATELITGSWTFNAATITLAGKMNTDGQKIAVGSNNPLILSADRSDTGTALQLEIKNAGGTLSDRLTISAFLATVVATWANITHTGMVMSGAINMNGQSFQNTNILSFNQAASSIQFTNVSNTGIIFSLRNAANTGVGLQISTLNGSDANTARFQITSGVDTAIITWSNVTHTGMVMSGTLAMGTNSITGITTLTSQETSFTDMTFGAVAGNDCTIRTKAAGAATVNRMSFPAGGAAGAVGARLFEPLFITEISAAITDIAGTGQLWVKDTTPNELWFTNDAGSDFQLNISGENAEMSIISDQTVTMETANTPIAVHTWSTGTVNTWTFTAGITGAITAYADHSGTVAGTVKITDVSHGLTTGDFITIRGSTNYNGVFEITRIDDDNFYITHSFDGNDGASDWEMGSYITPDTGAEGTYELHWVFAVSKSAGGTDTIKIFVYQDAAVFSKAEGRRKFSTNDVGSVYGQGIITVAAADRIWVAMQSNSTNNITIEIGNIMIHRL